MDSMQTKTTNAVLATFAADAYALGAHWIYDAQELAALPLDWDTLNAARSKWHKGKKKGDFTHYGDQSLILLEFLQGRKAFDAHAYYRFWKQKMADYAGYVDGATKNALAVPGSPSTDLSICGRIAPLLLCAQDRGQFLGDVRELVRMTHNSDLAHMASQFFGELLWDCRSGQTIGDGIQALRAAYPDLSHWVEQGVASRNQDTSKAIRGFGPACDIDGGFAGAIHLLSLDDCFEVVMRKNAKSGGDSSARGMVAAMILGSQDGFDVPDRWIRDIKQIQMIRTFLDACANL